MNDPSWILDNGVRISVTRVREQEYHIKDRDSERECTITFNNDRMLFNGEDIETEEFMAFIGLIDEVMEQLGGNAPGLTIDLENKW
jgi:hypothetical protein